jgi:hypothetical protein
MCKKCLLGKIQEKKERYVKGVGKIIVTFHWGTCDCCDGQWWSCPSCKNEEEFYHEYPDMH